MNRGNKDEDPRAIWAELGDRLRECHPLLYERVVLTVHDMVEAQETLLAHERMLGRAAGKGRWSA